MLLHTLRHAVLSKFENIDDKAFLSKDSKLFILQAFQRISKIISGSPGLCEKILGGRIRNQFGLCPTVPAESHTYYLKHQIDHEKPRRSIHPNPKTTIVFNILL